MTAYLIKATRKPVKIPDGFSLGELHEHVKFLQKNNVAASGLCIQVIDDEYEEQADSVEIGSLDFAGIPVIFSFGIC